MAISSRETRQARIAIRRPAANPALEYLPDFLVAMIIMFMPMRLFGTGPLTTLIWIACALLLIAYRPIPLGRTLLNWWPLLLVPIMMLLSFIWSEAPGISFRYGLQVLLTCVLGVYLARVLPPARLAVAMFLGMLVFCIASIIGGQKGPSDTGMVLIGFTGSKNAMGYAANMLVSAAAAVIFLPNMGPRMRLLGVVGILVGGYVVAVSASATAVLLSFAIVALFAVMCGMQRFSPAARVVTIVAVAAVGSLFVVAGDDISNAIDSFVRDVLHKDPETLTGRSYLWAQADDLISRRPLLGYGYQAIWLGDSSDSIGLLRWANITDGRSFNFHNTYRQIAVDIGLIGVGIFVATLVVSLIAAMRQFILTPTVATSFTFAFLLTTLAKSFTELVVGTFSAPTLLLFACCTYAFWRPPQPQTAKAPVSRSAPIRASGAARRFKI
ncbi:MAG: O-antigen ligase family protein [Alphaproteobacteria bacterium]